MLVLVAACLLCRGLLFSLPGFAQDVTVEHVLRAHVFNQAFEGFDFYSVTIEDDHSRLMVRAKSRRWRAGGFLRIRNE